MGIGPYRHLKAIAIIFFVVFITWVIWFPAAPAEARANLTAYTTSGPNTWQMKGFNVSGSAPQFIRDTLGWNSTNMLGNVGLGNGSLETLNATGNRVIDYTAEYTMAADVSTAPYDPSRLTTVSISGAGVEPGYAENITRPEFESETGQGNATTSAASLSENVTTGSQAEGRTGTGTKKIPLNDPYHTFLLGRPLDDMIYQHPHGIATNAYGRLMGLQLPGGACANVAIRVIGYGY